MSSLLFYAVSIGYILGIFFRSVYTFGVIEITWMMTTCTVVLLWVLKKKALSSLTYFGGCVVFIFCVLLGALRMDYAVNMTDRTLLSQIEASVSLEGVVVSEPDLRPHSVHITLQTQGVRVLVSTDRFTEVSYGDRLLVTGVLERPSAFETEFGRVFDYTGYLRARDISYMVPFAKIEVLGSGEGNPVIASLLSVKKSFIAHIEAAISYPQSALGTGLLLGVKQGLGESLEDAFRTTGIMHIVVLSGYNMMLVIGFVSFMFAFFLSPRVQIIVGVFAIVGFTLMVGLGASVVRAGLMALLVLLAQATGRTYAVLRALMLAAVVMLVINPYLLVHDVGFVLSFLATLGLIIGAPHIERYARFVPTFAGLRGFFVATVAVTVCVTPYLLYQIGEFSVVAVLVNMLVLPMVAPAMLLTFATGLLGYISAEAAVYVGYGAYLSLAYITKVATFFASLPFAAVVVPPFPFWLLLIVYAGLTYIFVRLYQKPSVKHANISLERVKDISAWTIVDEKTLQVQTSIPQRQNQDTPIFFR